METLMIALAVAHAMAAEEPPKRDTIETSKGDLVITFIGHGTLMFEHDGKVFHVDPWSRLADYGKLPKADIILLTHEHRDHLDAEAIAAVRKPETVLVLTEACAKKLDEGVVMKNGDKRTVAGVTIEAVPAYNVLHTRPTGEPYHPKGAGNGYVLTFADKRVYVAGDTENIPEMGRLGKIDVAFLPMNLPYTMTPEMVAEASRVIKPKILYPYHTGDTDVAELPKLLEDVPEIEVRIRAMQ